MSRVNSMRAVLCTGWGAPESLIVGEAPAPRAGRGEVRIAVEACGVNFADTLLIAGTYQCKPAFPFSPGLEVAGVAAECGAGVTTCAPGDRVIAVLDFGGYAGQVAAPAADVFRVPDAMDFAHAAGFAVVYGSAYAGLRWRAALAPGETLLVLGAGGGVGLAAVEVGKAMGARVIAAAGGPDKLALAGGRGADHLVDYRAEDLRARVKEITGGRGADVIFDPVGGDAFDTALRCVAWEGRIVVVGFASGRIPRAPANLLLVKNCAVMGVYTGAYRRREPARYRAALDELFAWWGEGRLRPHVSRRFPLERAAEALRVLMDRAATGKVVLTVGGG